jgi:hypothetical protein
LGNIPSGAIGQVGTGRFGALVVSTQEDIVEIRLRRFCKLLTTAKELASLMKKMLVRSKKTEVQTSVMGNKRGVRGSFSSLIGPLAPQGSQNA